MPGTRHSSEQQIIMAKRDKASALKALAKRPALVSAIEKGNKKIKQLRDIVEKSGVTSSGGFIRSLVWATICILDDNKFVKFAKNFKKSELSDFSRPVKDKPVSSKDVKPSKKVVVEEDEEDDEPVKTKKQIRLEEREHRLEEKRKKEAQEKAQKEYAAKKPAKSKVEKSGLVKLIRPIGDIPANHPVLAEYYDGFWHIKGKHIALSNMIFVESKLKETVDKKKTAVKPVKKEVKKVEVKKLAKKVKK